MGTGDDHDWTDKRKLGNRARRIEGQAAAVARMLDEGRSCREVLQQLAAFLSAGQELAVLVVEDHVLARSRAGADADALSAELASHLRRVLKR
ncbi:MAG TPA: metal-sensitive transcriptional regulator [Actinomycetota bacterium]|nr:metal-sensitive transcriptional regulator [Actinomycetota bacterium]